MGLMGKTKTPFSIDFGVGGTIVPAPVIRILPVLLDGFEKPEILTYSLESTISEKLDAIVRFMESTGRMKDFYDIYYIATSFDFEGRKVQEAIYKTFSNRGTPIEQDSVQVLDPPFQAMVKEDEFMRRWNSSLRQYI
jgi:predicted nucleotidyltransferase component of viral defense system